MTNRLRTIAAGGLALCGVAGAGSYEDGVAGWFAIPDAVQAGPAQAYPTAVYHYEFLLATNTLGQYTDTGPYGTNYGWSGLGAAAPTWQRARRLAFDGGDNIRATNWFPVGITAVTMVAWVNLRSAADSQYFMSYFNVSFITGIGTSSGKYFIQVGGPAFFGPTLSTTNWTHVACAWASNSVAWVWTNGVLAATGAHAGAYANWTGEPLGNHIRVGNRPEGSGGSAFFGSMGESMTLTSFWSTAEAAAHYNATKGDYQ